MFLLGFIPIIVAVFAGFIGLIPGITTMFGIILGLVAVLISESLIPITKTRWHYLVTLVLLFIQLVFLNELTWLINANAYIPMYIRIIIYIIIIPIAINSYLKQSKRNI